MSWMVGGQSFNGTVDVTKADQHQYTYSFKRTITSSMCGKTISYQATGFHNVSGSSLILLKNCKFIVQVTAKQVACLVYALSVAWLAENYNFSTKDCSLLKNSARYNILSNYSRKTPGRGSGGGKKNTKDDVICSWAVVENFIIMLFFFFLLSVCWNI